MWTSKKKVRLLETERREMVTRGWGAWRKEERLAKDTNSQQ